MCRHTCRCHRSEGHQGAERATQPTHSPTGRTEDLACCWPGCGRGHRGTDLRRTPHLPGPKEARTPHARPHPGEGDTSPELDVKHWGLREVTHTLDVDHLLHLGAPIHSWVHRLGLQVQLCGCQGIPPVWATPGAPNPAQDSCQAPITQPSAESSRHGPAPSFLQSSEKSYASPSTRARRGQPLPQEAVAASPASTRGRPV